ncbi:MAG: response regulator [Desulfobacteraceae bacterium]|nr:MAG: response regulator [Desulfobacteraceae bacterium]
MTHPNLLRGKRIIVVDDENDILETIAQLLDMCEIVMARSFEEARELLEKERFDIAILDIMGVDGFSLLNIATKKNVIPVMLTANALKPEYIVKSYNEGAASFLPKEKMEEIAVFLNDVLEARQKGKDPWWRWAWRLASYWRKEFGKDWEHQDQEFWQKLKKL